MRFAETSFWAPSSRPPSTSTARFSQIPQPDANEPPIGDPGEQLAADRRLIEAYRRLPEDPALMESAARLAARTAPESYHDS